MRLIKRLFDLILSLLLLALLSPVMIATYLFILVKLGNPVIFKQQRPGLNGKPFFIYKFRSMTNEHDDSGNLLPDEKRLPTVGKLIRSLSLDELPQLYNVLKGEMSFVGPRPLLMEYLPLYTAEQARRHDVRPGISGWAQVNGRNSLSWSEKFALDVWYVENWSFWLDLKILILTACKVLTSEGINQRGVATVEKFKGDK